ncbi:MAG TPA: hypothetical protein VFO62_12745 [Candidatus Binatia bacterium]|nr:hypothetical protein [Candidatus Binatia bacterium]
MEQSGLGTRVGASLLAVVVGLATVPPVGAVEPVVGTIQVSGAAWVASSSTDWSRLSSTRPLVAGDRLRTGSDGYLLADLGDAGVVGLYGNAEVATTSAGAGPVVEVQKGKVAFHLSPNSRMKLNAQGTGIASGTMAADGYVEYDANGTPVVVVEDGALNVRTASGATKTLSRGDRLALGGPKAPAPVQIAQAEDDSSRKAGAVAGEEEPAAAAFGETQYAGLAVPAWAGVAVVAGAIGGAIYYGASDGDNNRSDSPSGD